MAKEVKISGFWGQFTTFSFSRY